MIETPNGLAISCGAKRRQLDAVVRRSDRFFTSSQRRVFGQRSLFIQPGRERKERVTSLDEAIGSILKHFVQNPSALSPGDTANVT
jgi:hypothetical protein